MTLLCDRVAAFSAGKLSRSEADAFRGHLKTCSRCSLRLRFLAEVAAEDFLDANPPPEDLTPESLAAALGRVRYEIQPGRRRVPATGWMRATRAAVVALGAALVGSFAVMAYLSTRPEPSGPALTGDGDVEDVAAVAAQLEARRMASDVGALAASARFAERLDLHATAAGFYREALPKLKGAARAEVERAVASIDATFGAWRAEWKKLSKAGWQAIETSTPVPLALVERFAGHAHYFFYPAVMGAQSKAKVAALRPWAEALDRLDGRRDAQNFLERVLASNWTRRAPAAAAFASFFDAAPVRDAAALAALEKTIRRSGQGDILFGFLSRGFAKVEDLDEPDRLVADLDNRWLTAEARLIRMRALFRSGRYREILEWSDRAPRPDHMPPYQRARALYWVTQGQLGLHQLPEAYETIAQARPLVGLDGHREWGLAVRFEFVAAEAARQREAFALMRLHMAELMGREQDNRSVRASVRILGMRGAVSEGRPEVVQQWAGPPEGWSRKDLWRVVDAHRMNRSLWPADVIDDRMVTLLDETTDPAARAQLFAARGRLWSDEAPDTARVYLDRAVEIAQRQPTNRRAKLALATVWLTDAMSAGARGAWPQTLDMIGRYLGIDHPPAACALGVAVDDRRKVAVVVGKDERFAGVYDDAAQVGYASVEVRDAVPPELLPRLEGCEAVEVLATPPLNGQPELLPTTMVWAYRSLRDAASPVAPPGIDVVAVARPASPADLSLPPLTRFPDLHPGQSVLEGEAATPSAVLEAIGRARLIAIFAHGGIRFGAGPAAVVLAPDADGDYLLEADAVAERSLPRNLVVLLASCETSYPGTSVVPGGRSLPAALIEAGAAGVVAPAGAPREAEAHMVYRDLVGWLDQGLSPANAAREARRVHSGLDWVRSLVVFR